MGSAAPLNQFASHDHQGRRGDNLPWGPSNRYLVSDLPFASLDFWLRPRPRFE